LKGTHPGTIPARFDLIQFRGFRGEDLYYRRKQVIMKITDTITTLQVYIVYVIDLIQIMMMM
jgi:hypothetical protein